MARPLENGSFVQIICFSLHFVFSVEQARCSCFDGFGSRLVSVLLLVAARDFHEAD